MNLIILDYTNGEVFIEQNNIFNDDFDYEKYIETKYNLSVNMCNWMVSKTLKLKINNENE